MVNDTAGHIVGDEVLLMISGCIQGLMHNPDICGARFGGDEFFVIFKNIDVEESEKLCRHLAHQISSYIFDNKGQAFTVSISYGADEYQPQETPVSFIQRLDAMMYQMKHADNVHKYNIWDK